MSPAIDAADAPDSQDPRVEQKHKMNVFRNARGCYNCGSPKASIQAPCVACGASGGRTVTRRRAMQAGAVAAGTLVLGASGSVAAQGNTQLNWSADYNPNPYIPVEVRVREHEGEMDELDFTDDSGEEDSLNRLGVVIPDENPDTRDEDDEEDKDAWNPVTLEARNFLVSQNKAFPRDAEDDDDDPIYWHQDPDTYWNTTDATVGTASMDSLEIEATAVGGTASFSEQIDITSGLGRKRLHLVMDVVDLQSDGTINVHVKDEGGDSVTATIDPDGNEDDDNVLATSTGDSIHVEPKLEDLDGDIDLLDEIDEIEFEFAGNTGEIQLYGLDLAREGRTDWGTREYKDEDDEFDTETVRQPSGEFSITSLDTLGVSLSEDDVIRDVIYDAEMRASELPDSHVDVVFEDADRRATGDLTERMKAVFNFELEQHFDLSWESIGGIKDYVYFDSTNYLEAGYEHGLDDPEDVEEVEDDELDLTDVTSDYETGEFDEVVELSTDASADQVTAFYLDMRITPETASEWQDTTAVGAPAREPGGIRDWVFGLPGMIVGGLGTILAFNRWGPRLLGALGR